MDNFNEIKSEVLRRAKEAKACTEQYGRAYKAATMAELCEVIKDNFTWVCENEVLTGDFVERYREEFAAEEIFVNVDVRSGFLLACGRATVTACGRATVTAYGSATVTACDSATVMAYDSATVTACDSATVEACGSATVEACGSATVEACGSATVTACGSATVTAYDSATGEACGSATVEAYDSAYVTSYRVIECKFSDNAIYRVQSENKILYASDGVTFEKIHDS